MPKMVITPTELQSAATTVNKCMEDQQAIINDIRTLISDIVSEWEGEAQQGFQRAFERAEPEYKRFAPDLSAFSEFLNNYANTMETLDIGGGRQADNI